VPYSGTAFRDWVGTKDQAVTMPYTHCMNPFDRITSDPGVMNGQPCIRGMRLTVRRVLVALQTFGSLERVRENYPELEDEDVRQALAYAASALPDETIDLSAA